jgi:hypothetical protein
VLVPELPRKTDPEPIGFGAPLLPLIASGGTVLVIFALLAVAAGGPNWVLAFAVVLMIVGFATCYGLIQRVGQRLDGAREDAVDAAAAASEPAARDLPLDNPSHPDVKRKEDIARAGHMRMRRGAGRTRDTARRGTSARL